jgi:hypothetical protein
VTLALGPLEPTRELPNGELYYSPQGLYDFQVDGIAECIVRTAGPDGVIAVWDTGIGKTPPLDGYRRLFVRRR